MYGDNRQGFYFMQKVYHSVNLDILSTGKRDLDPSRLLTVITLSKMNYIASDHPPQKSVEPFENL